MMCLQQVVNVVQSPTIINDCQSKLNLMPISSSAFFPLTTDHCTKCALRPSRATTLSLQCLQWVKYSKNVCVCLNYSTHSALNLFSSTRKRKVYQLNFFLQFKIAQRPLKGNQSLLPLWHQLTLLPAMYVCHEAGNRHSHNWHSHTIIGTHSSSCTSEEDTWRVKVSRSLLKECSAPRLNAERRQAIIFPYFPLQTVMSHTLWRRTVLLLTI